MSHQLICHPDTPSGQVRSVLVEWTAGGDDQVLLTFKVNGAEALVLPEQRSPARTDGLWRTTCFEMFWQALNEVGYIELNFSPSLGWAAYAFDSYRDGMREQPMVVEPVIEAHHATTYTVDVDVDFSTFPGDAIFVGLSAVIEETDGIKSYWALRHPPGPPDFHHPDCFALRIPALGRS